MSDDEDYNSEEDVDYVPTEAEQVSEEENSGDEEDLSLLHDGETDIKAGSVRKKGSGQKKSELIEARKRKGGIRLDNDEIAQGEGQTPVQETDEDEVRRKEELAKQIAEEQELKKKDKEKKRADDLWSSFLSDTGTKKTTPRPSQSGSSDGGLSSLTSQILKPSPKTDIKEVVSSTSVGNSEEKTGKMTITQVFDFAGEEVKITKEVDVDSKEAKAEQKKLEKTDEETPVSKSLSYSGSSIPFGLKRPGGGGLGSVLNKISKKNKMGTLEKSKLDWNSFKQNEGIEEDLKIHNKGKQGYTGRMDFLNRADQRQYEIERDIRLGKTSKR